MPSLPSPPVLAPLQQGNSPLSSPQPLGGVQDYPLEFSATGSEYFRIWIVNLLLIVVTLGIYLPWAKVRKLKYFYTNTRIDGDALDFHAEPRKMLRGTAIVGVFLLMYSFAADVAPLAGIVALVALLAVWPPLFRAAMKFRLANTSWRGMRFRFVDTGLREPYLCLVPALAMLLLPGALLGFGGDDEGSQNAAVADAVTSLIGVIVLLWLVLLPYFFWRIKRYQHNHYAWGPLQTEYRSGVLDTYKVVGVTVLVALGIMVVFAVAAAALLPTLFIGGLKGLGMGVLLGLIPLLVAFVITINIAPKAFFMARMQNLLWSRTGNRYFRFKSGLRARSFMALQFKNYALILITLGLYWPFAVVATHRMQIEAMTLKSRVDLQSLTDAARKRETDAAGDMAADLFGLDIGM